MEALPASDQRDDQVPAGGPGEGPDVVGIARQDLVAVHSCVDHRAVDDIAQTSCAEQGADTTGPCAAELDLQDAREQHGQAGLAWASSPDLGDHTGGRAYIDPVSLGALE